jgi:hypothetical protein
MKQSLFSLVVSMAASLLVVNASAQDLPSRNQPSPQSNIKDSVKESQTDLSRLIGILMRTGDEQRLAPLSPLIGMTGDPPIKGRDFTLPRTDGKERRECTIVFSESSQNNVQNTEKHPTCLYIQHKFVSGHDSEAIYYRLSLDGKLEHLTVSHSKYDDNGKPVPGSAVRSDRDINSPEVQKAFKAELNYWTKEWVKQEQKKTAAAGSGSASNAEAIPTSATAAHTPLNKEAATAAPLESVEAHRAENNEIPAARAPGSPY